MVGTKKRFNELTKADKDFILEVSTRQIPAVDKWKLLYKQYGAKERTARNWINWVIESQEEYEITIQPKSASWHHKGSNVVFITYGQNATKVHSGLWKNLVAYAEYRGAEIAVVQGRYRNPTSVWSLKQQNDEYWADEIEPYLMGNRVQIFNHLGVLGDFKVRPTTANPLNRMHEVTGPMSSVIGHPRIHMRVVPVSAEMPTKTVWTTGAVTKKNYTDSQNGKIAEFHHTYGFLVVEFDGEHTHIRQVTADDETGNFYDLHWKVAEGEVSDNEGVDAMIVSDLHAAFAVNANLYATQRMMEDLRPNMVVMHDVFDAYSISHHHRKDYFLQLQKYTQGTDLVEWELEQLFKTLKGFGFTKQDLYIIQSNHGNHLDKWLNDTDWRTDIKNATMYLKLAQLKADMAINGDLLTKNLLGRLLEMELPNTKAIHPNQSLMVHGFELCLHGDIGSNGSRGGINQFKKLPTKTVSGHSHTPGRADGALQVGMVPHVESMEYMSGPHNKACANVIIHKDGKAQHLFVFDGTYSQKDAKRKI